MDLLDIAKDCANETEYKNLVQLMKDGPRCEYLPEDYFIQKLVDYKKGA